MFLLTAVGNIIAVLSNRLARVVDRTRTLEEERPAPSTPKEQQARQEELGVLGRRLRLIYIAITAEVLCVLFVGLVIIVAFVDAFASANLSQFIATLFIFAMMAFIGGMIVFLREIFLAVATTRAIIR